MSKKKNDFLYESTILGFFCASLLMRQRPTIRGSEYLEDLPVPVIFAVTHDSYFEVPSLSRVYRAIRPRPVFTIMAKNEFLGGRYLSSNFFKNSPIFNYAFRIIDKTGIPGFLFRRMNLISIPRPFTDIVQKKSDEIKNEISLQFLHFKQKIHEGFSTLIFPEGTTWGYGGLKKIRSAVHQLVATSFEQYKKEVYVLPINVKVDRLVKGWKDVFINVGKPHFVNKSRDDFNQYLFNTLKSLHTITLSQIGAYYLKKFSLIARQARAEVRLSREVLTDQLEKAVESINWRVKEKVLPALDTRLIEKSYFSKKVDRFIKYCVKEKYLILEKSEKRGEFVIDVKRVLAMYPEKSFRKLNPVGFHANELASLGDGNMESLFNFPVRRQ